MKVCSLDICKKLKLLNVKQESIFYWGNDTLNSNDYFLMYEPVFPNHYVNCSAFTVAELGEMLPCEIKNHKLVQIFYPDNEINLSYNLDEGYYGIDEIFQINEKGEANARGKMLIYLIENKLIKVEDINK